MTAAAPTRAKPILDRQRPRAEQLLVNVFVIVPMLALVAAVPLAWGWGLSWTDIALAAAFYLLSGFGVTVGFHRYFTHRSFTARRGLRNALAIAGSLALQGDVVTWVADHRRRGRPAWTRSYSGRPVGIVRCRIMNVLVAELPASLNAATLNVLETRARRRLATAHDA